MPLALALEESGYKQYSNKGPFNLFKNMKEKARPERGNYMIISGEKSISKLNYSDYIKIESENRNGERIKVILGSETAAEGLDFKYIREVHILDPWHHLNKLEQIIGRGIDILIKNCH